MCEPKTKWRATNAAMLNWIASMQSARMRYDHVFLNGADPWQESLWRIQRLPLADEVFDFVLYESKATGFMNANQPAYWGNKFPLFPDLDPLKVSRGFGYKQYVDVFGSEGGNPAFILTSLQTAYWKGDIGFVNKYCKNP